MNVMIELVIGADDKKFSTTTAECECEPGYWRKPAKERHVAGF